MESGAFQGGFQIWFLASWFVTINAVIYILIFVEIVTTAFDCIYRLNLPIIDISSYANIFCRYELIIHHHLCLLQPIHVQEFF